MLISTLAPACCGCRGPMFQTLHILKWCRDRAVAKSFVNWLSEMAQDVYSIDMDSWSIHYVECPQQGTGPDCAIYIMHFMECLYLGAQITITEACVPDMLHKSS